MKKALKIISIIIAGFLFSCTSKKVLPSKIEIENQKGCFIKNPKPVENERVMFFGTCKDGVVDGKGTLIWYVDDKLDLKVEGSWDAGVLNGNTKMLFGSGGSYKGMIKNELRDGFGTMKYHNGDYYEGFWKNNKRHGKGVFIFHNGTRFEGTYVNDYEEGFGKIFYENGQKFEGNFEKGEIKSHNKQ